MGLLDILNGMQNGPRGPDKPGSQTDSGGMSPMTMAILALLAWKAAKHFGGRPARRHAEDGAAPADAEHRQCRPARRRRRLSDLMKGGLGGLLAGGAAGSILSGGLGDLLGQLQKGGQGEVANSWVGKGENKAIAPGDLANALGADQIEAIASQAGMSRDDLLKGLSQYLPGVIDQLTPDGRLPNENELSRWI